jgi:UDP-N-acetylglucosamine 1-carboxyvinyltransferase
MTFITAGIVTGSNIKINRCPLDFIRFEMNMLGKMGLNYEMSHIYKSYNGFTELVDIVLHKSELIATNIVIKPKTWPGINPDNAPFFVLIATQTKGLTKYNDWMFDGRNCHFAKLRELGADIQLIKANNLKLLAKISLYLPQLLVLTHFAQRL